MEVLLDTNFIISCVIRRIDFINELETLGFRVKVPREVLQEMKDLKKELGVSHKERAAIDVAFALFGETNIKKMKLGGKNVDGGLIARGKEGYYIATLDKEIKLSVPNRVVILGAKNKLGVERD
jgi:rRNA-processing protein FCF1